MTHNFKKHILLLQFLLITLFSFGQGIPDILYYKFDGTGMKVPNYASNPPAGTDTAIITGNMTQGNFGTCQSGGIRGTGASQSSGDYMNTKWAGKLSSSWTISMWMDSMTPTKSGYNYLFGDYPTGSIRCFTTASNPGDIFLRLPSPHNDFIIPSAFITPTVTTFVYDSAKRTLEGYIDGKLYHTANLSTALVLNGTGPFLIGASPYSTCLNEGAKMDEFRIYSRALTANEVLFLKYGSTSTRTVNIVHCDSVYKSPSGKYAWNISGIYLDTVIGKYNCDEFLTINLTISENKYSTVNYTVCDSFNLPSGQITAKTSGIYKGKLQLPSGCDSFITFNLSVLKASKSDQKIKICRPFTSPSGKFKWDISGIYNDTIPNSNGCDSVITFDIDAGHISDSFLTINACEFFVSPSKKYKWESSGLYFDTIVNYTGCDSLLTIDLTINDNSIFYDTVNACSKYVSTNEQYAWSESGDYFYTIPNSKGCDSSIYLHLTISKPTSATISITDCQAHLSPSGKYLWNVNGTYYDTIPNTQSCDSCLTINFNLITVKSSNLIISSCNKYASPSGKANWNKSGIYSDTLLSYLGCDSVVYINLTIVPVTISVKRHLDVLTSDAAGALYQWLDCNNNYAAINGENNQNFNVKANGIYAVQVIENSCKDTSICINISNVGIKNSQSTSGYSLYPNPTFDKLKIQAKEVFINPIIKIYNLAGIEKQPIITINNTSIEIDINSFLNGVYFLELTDGDISIRYRILKI